MNAMVSDQVLTRPDVIRSYLLVEFITLDRRGAPVCWPVLCEFERGRIVVSTGYVFPAKARNAQRNPRVAAFFSDPAATLGPDDGLLVLVQGDAEVYDQDLQRNVERFYDSGLRFPKTPAVYKLLMRLPFLMKSYVGYMTRIYIEVTPRREHVWTRGDQPPAALRASRPASFTPTTGFKLPAQVETWLPRYSQPPVLSFVDESGYPAAVRVQAALEPGRIVITNGVPASEGAPGCLTYHRVAPDMMTNDAFLIRGHLDAGGNMIPERVVGWQGTEDDRGTGSPKGSRLIGEWRKQLISQLAKEGRAIPVVRPSPRRK